MESRLSRLIEASVGPAPWYLKTFPPLSAEGVAYSWRLIDDGSVVALERDDETALSSRWGSTRERSRRIGDTSSCGGQNGKR